MPTKEIKSFNAVVSPATNDKILTQQTVDNINRYITPAQITGVGDPKAHAASHISGGADAFTSSQLLEALIKRIRESGGPTDLLVGAIADLELLGRSGTGIAGVAKATQAEAEAGTDNAKWMTALRVKQAIQVFGASAAYPVGSIFMSVVSTNPATLLGFGTWAAFATGRCIVGIDAGQTEFDTVEETGGAKTHTLITAEIPSHTHTEQTVDGAIGGVTAAGSATLTSLTPRNETAGAGGGGAHNNLQPYIVVYMWKRTA